MVALTEIKGVHSTVDVCPILEFAAKNIKQDYEVEF